jgi:hypothetical protein
MSVNWPVEAGAAATDVQSISLIQSLAASLRDIETGAFSDANEVQAEARALLAEYGRAHSPAASPFGLPTALCIRPTG